MHEVFIVSAARTPIGGFLGALASFNAPQLGALAIKKAYEKVNLPPEALEAVVLGHVLTANVGQSPARQAALLANVPNHVDCTGINKVCASGMKAVMFGAQSIQLGHQHLVMTGGMESMSQTPHYANHRVLTKLGHTTMVDGILRDGLTDGLQHYHMGVAAEGTARKFQISRAEQDAYALDSYARACAAADAGAFKNEILPITLPDKTNASFFQEDEDIRKVIPEKVSKLKPAFETNGTITAANASNLNDGAAALLLASKTAVEKYQWKPLARIVAFADAAQAPEDFGTAPSLAIPKALKMANLSLSDIDCLEINEAYAAVALANQKILNIPGNKLNVYGGAVAMGHPLGASGARILCTLQNVMHHKGGRWGLAAICNGGGGASAMVIENFNR